MTLHFTIRPITQSTNRLRQLRPWGDPVMFADTYSVFVRTINGQPIGQFSMVVPYMLDKSGNWLGDWSANTLSMPITHDQIMQIASIQVADDYTVDQKMGWLNGGGDGKWGFPMKSSLEWEIATDLRLIGAIWAGQWVEIIDHAVFTVNFNGKFETIPMSRIKTFDDWPNLSRKHPQVQEVTAVDKQDSPILPKGHIWMPVLLKGASNWVFDRWLL